MQRRNNKNQIEKRVTFTRIYLYLCVVRRNRPNGIQMTKCDAVVRSNCTYSKILLSFLSFRLRFLRFHGRGLASAMLYIFWFTVYHTISNNKLFQTLLYLYFLFGYMVRVHLTRTHTTVVRANTSTMPYRVCLLIFLRFFFNSLRIFIRWRWRLLRVDVDFRVQFYKS